MNDFVSRFRLHLLLWVAIAVPLLVSGPLAMFANNYGDFDLGAKQLAWLILPRMAYVVVLALVTAFLPLQSLIHAVLLWVAIALYVQGNFLVWDYGRFDGTEIPWQEYGWRGLVDCGVWAALLFVTLMCRRRIVANTGMFLGGLCILQLGTALMSFYQSAAPLEMRVSEKAGRSLYSFSKERNVLFVLLDEFSSRGFYQLLRTDEALKKEFRDFTFYRDTLAAFPTTYAAVPAILTGQRAPLNGSMTAYFETAAPYSISEQLAEAGWAAESVTLHPLCKSFKNSQCQSLAQATAVDPETAARHEAYKLLDLTLFRYTPHQAKRVIYNDERWFLQRLGRPSPPTTSPPSEVGSKKSKVKFSLVPFQESSIDFLKTFTARMDVESSRPSFKLLHILIPHGPYTMNPACVGYAGAQVSAPNRFLNNGRCGLNLVKDLLSKMKQLAIYDATTIVIMADHGTPVGFDFPEFGAPMDKKLRRAFPLLLMKPQDFRASENGELTIDTTPVSQLDILSLVSRVGNLNLKIPPSDARDSQGNRIFHHYQWSNMNWSLDTLPPIHSYVIKGDSWRLDSWHPLDSTP